MIPGLTDIHMHIESSMTTPAFFWKMCRRKWCDDGGFRASRNGQCQRYPRDSGNDLCGKECTYSIVFYGIPSSVPSTSEKLETTGGIIDCSAMKHLLEEKDVVCVGEIMNYRQIIRENDLEISLVSGIS